MSFVKNLIVILCMLSASVVMGQKLDIGLQLGGGFYDGDLSLPSTWDNATNLNPAIGFIGRFEYFDGIVGRVGALYTHIQGDDSQSPLAWQRARNLNFRSDIFEGHFALEFHPLKWFRQTSSLPMSPYVFVGAAYFHYNPQAFIDNQWVDLQPLGTEGQGMQGYEGKYDLYSLAIPFGFGARYTINEHFYVDFEYGARRTDTDYLDDISKTYVSVGDLSEANGGLAARLGNKINADTGDQRGNAQVKDWYGVPVITLAYRFDLDAPGYIKRPGRRKPIGCPSKF